MKKLTLILLLFLLGCSSYSTESKNHADYQECNNLDEDTKECRFFKDGYLYSEGLFYKGKEVDIHKYYNLNNKLDSIVEYIYIESDSIVANQIFYFNENNDTVYTESSFFRVQSNEKIGVEDSLEVSISVNVPKKRNKKFKMEIHLDNPNNPKETMIFVSDKLHRQLFISSNELGDYQILGTILVGEFDTEEQEYPTDVRKFYFKINYQVEEGHVPS